MSILWVRFASGKRRITQIDRLFLSLRDLCSLVYAAEGFVQKCSGAECGQCRAGLVVVGSPILTSAIGSQQRSYRIADATSVNAH